MMNLIAQLGVGGIIVILSLREMFRFLAGRSERKGNGENGNRENSNGHAGNKPVAFWEKTITDIVRAEVAPMRTSLHDINNKLATIQAIEEMRGYKS